MGLEKDYLKELAQKLTESLEQFHDDAIEKNEQKEILTILQGLMDFEQDCRKKYAIGARFHVIHSQLQSLINAYKKELPIIEETKENLSSINVEIKPDEQIVYVYLFNAQGGKLSSWLSLLTSKALIDHSINRPIYANFEHVDELIRSKTDGEQHAFIKVIIKKSDILMPFENSILKDNLGNRLLRIKYGSIQQDKILSFFYRNKEYVLSKHKDGELAFIER